MSALVSTNLLQKKMMGIKETPYGVYFLYGKSYFGKKKTVLASTADSRLSKLDQQEAKESAKLSEDKVGQSIKIPCFSNCLSAILGLSARVGCPTLQNI